MIEEHEHITNQQHLITAIKVNDPKALRRLYVDNFRKTELYILKNNGTMPQAKDIYQEAFITVWRNIKEGRFEPQNETAVQGYLYQIAKNKWLDHLRSSRYKKTVGLGDHAHVYPQAIEEDTVVPANESDVLLEQAMAAFNKLGAECKKLLMAFYFENKNMRQLADEFKIGEASMRNKKYRCILKLRELAQFPNIS